MKPHRMALGFAWLLLQPALVVAVVVLVSPYMRWDSKFLSLCPLAALVLTGVYASERFQPQA